MAEAADKTPEKPADKPLKTAASKLTEATVLRGTVVYDHPDTEPEIDDTRKAGSRPGAPVSAGPGESVFLPAAEVARLRGRGVLVDPAQPGPTVRSGPHLTDDEGPATSQA